MSLEDLRTVIREEMRKILLEAFKELVPYVSDEEQAEMDEIAGEPEDYDEDFEDL
ncbi:MAG: hypothetical protein J7L91_05385 [Candidatus Korarchaeota archaeon]|nr:hypothetical protein [Candidatus Korarchaeota archaeon]